MHPRTPFFLAVCSLSLSACDAARQRPDADAGYPPNNPTMVASSTPAASSTAPEPRPPVGRIRIDADVDGLPGLESVELHADGTLVAGKARGRVDPSHVDLLKTNVGGGNATQQAKLSVVLVDKARGIRGVLIEFRAESDEDVPIHPLLFIVDGVQLRSALDALNDAEGAIELKFPGDGTALYVEDGWVACKDVEDRSRTVARKEVTLRLDASGTMHATTHKPTAQKLRCTNLSACPFVYVVGAEGPVLAGEILRNVRGKSAYTVQPLQLGPAAPPTVAVRIVEEKSEVTYLDELYLEVNGRRFAPRACANTVQPDYCVGDQKPYILRRGSALDVEFEIPSASNAPVLYARGYYVPIPDKSIAGPTGSN